MSHGKDFNLPDVDQWYVYYKAYEEEPPAIDQGTSIARVIVARVRSDTLNNAVFSSDLRCDKVDVGTNKAKLT